MPEIRPIFRVSAMTGSTSLPHDEAAGTGAGKAVTLIHCNVIDVLRGVVHQDRTIVIDNGRIESISDGLPGPRREAPVADMQNRYLIPGLIDAHCHSTLAGEAVFNPFGIFTTLRQVRRNYIQQLAHGVTTIRDMGALPGLLHRHLKRIAKGSLAGPRVVHCNAFMNVRGGHPDIDPSDISMFSAVALAFTGNPSCWFKDIPDLERKLRQNSESGASFIKLTMDDRSLLCGKGAIPVYSDEQLDIIFSYARKNTLPVAGHIHTKFGFDRALRHGIGSMEHTLADALLTDREIAQLAARKIAVVPTMIIAQMLAAEEAFDGIPACYRNGFIDNELSVRRQMLNALPAGYIEPAIHARNRGALRHYMKHGWDNLYKKRIFMPKPDLYFNILLHGPQNLLRMKDAGIVIGCGTDAGIPYVYHGMLWREMEMLARIGFSHEEVLRCATINNAKILRIDDETGTIEPGKLADMVVLKENPLEVIETCRTPQMVIRGGRIHDFSESHSGGA